MRYLSICRTNGVISVVGLSLESLQLPSLRNRSGVSNTNVETTEIFVKYAPNNEAAGSNWFQVWRGGAMEYPEFGRGRSGWWGKEAQGNNIGRTLCTADVRGQRGVQLCKCTNYEIVYVNLGANRINVRRNIWPRNKSTFYICPSDINRPK